MCFGSSREWGKQAQQPIFAPFLHCARAGQNHALWFQHGKPGGGPTQFKESRGHSGDAQLQENGRLQRPTMKRADLAPAGRL